MVHRLITIPISHFCEKARWALELAQISYREEPHLQVLHYIPARLAGGGATVPILVSEGGEVLRNSSEIVHWVDTVAQLGLYPEDPELRREVEMLEHEFDSELGPHSRLWMYQHFLRRKDLAVRYAGYGTPKWQQKSIGVMFGCVAWFIRRRFSITEEQANKSLLQAKEQMDRVAKRIEDGSRYLVGERFSAADLSFACMAVPLVFPPNYGVPLPGIEEFPSACVKVVEQYRQHPAGQFALRLFREHRPLPLRLMSEPRSS
tara:strand:+ start:1214 stop:1996 length:783 start_codon:yes stop_codon:yes gene_type:complete